MQTIFYILAIVYIIAINLYGVLILHFQQKEKELSPKVKSVSITDLKLFITGLLGGATGIYAFMLVFKYKLKSLPFMVIMPIIAALNIYLIILVFKSGRTYYSGYRI